MIDTFETDTLASYFVNEGAIRSQIKPRGGLWGIALDNSKGRDKWGSSKLGSLFPFADPFEASVWLYYLPGTKGRQGIGVKQCFGGREHQFAVQLMTGSGDLGQIRAKNYFGRYVDLSGTFKVAAGWHRVLVRAEGFRYGSIAFDTQTWTPDKLMGYPTIACSYGRIQTAAGFNFDSHYGRLFYRGPHVGYFDDFSVG